MRGLDGERATPGWLLDELASAGRENLDPAHVERYDAKMDARAAEEVELLRSWELDRHRLSWISGAVRVSSHWPPPLCAAAWWPLTCHL